MVPNPLDFEAYFAAKGVLYAKVEKGKDSNPIHLFTLHSSSDSFGDYHDTRVKQFNKVREFIDSKQIPSDELVLLSGDFNEDKDCRLRRCEGVAKCEDRSYYNSMVDILSVDTPMLMSNSTFTYDTEANNLLKNLHASTDCIYYQYTLDYMFFSNNHLLPLESSYCNVLNPLASDDTDLSDHLPLACKIVFGTNVEELIEDYLDAEISITNEEGKDMTR